MNLASGGKRCPCNTIVFNIFPLRAGPPDAAIGYEGLARSFREFIGILSSSKTLKIIRLLLTQTLGEALCTTGMCIAIQIMS